MARLKSALGDAIIGHAVGVFGGENVLPELDVVSRIFYQVLLTIGLG